MDLVIPLGGGSKWDNNELRYSLRSVEKFLSGIDNVFIIGMPPAWMQNIVPLIYLDRSDLPSSANIYRKIRSACNDERVSREFMFTNDDIFFTSPVDANNYPYYYEGTLENKQRKLLGNWYRENMVNTYNLLTKGNYSTLNYDIHVPIRYDKEYFKMVMGAEFVCDMIPTVLKSIYCNKMNVGGIETKDTKMRGLTNIIDIENKINRFHCFSTGDQVLEGKHLKKRLEEMFPYPSKYEK